jgi:hypothetical protein
METEATQVTELVACRVTGCHLCGAWLDYRVKRTSLPPEVRLRKPSKTTVWECTFRMSSLAKRWIIARPPVRQNLAYRGDCARLGY